jgi:hypothetical protein
MGEEVTTNLMWYVFRWNEPGEGFECLGAFSRENEARAFLETLRSEWLATAKGTRPNSDFRVECSCLSWSEFCESIFYYRFRELAEPIKFLARAHGWDQSPRP